MQSLIFNIVAEKNQLLTNKTLFCFFNWNRKQNSIYFGLHPKKGLDTKKGAWVLLTQVQSKINSIWLKKFIIKSRDYGFLNNENAGNSIKIIDWLSLGCHSTMIFDDMLKS